MFALENLLSLAAEPCEPWTFAAPIPDEVRGKSGKRARDAWVSDPATRHQIYSPWRGTISNRRIAKPAKGEEGNPPERLHAFVLDYDAPLTEEELKLGIARLGDYVPNYYERTLSGNARLVWLLERPVMVPNWKFAVELLNRALHKIPFEHVAVGLDKPAFLDPGRYYTNSCEWYAVDAARRIPHALAQGWVMETAEQHGWRKDAGALEIPLPIVAGELAKKFPGFVQWPGDFALESQGPSFWVEGSTSPKSAVVKPTGLFTFSGHAVKPFWSWRDLLGAAFADRYTSELMGKAVEGIFHDGRAYFRKDGYGQWRPFSKEDIVIHLSTDRGLSTTKQDGVPSEAIRAISYIHSYQGIDGAAPFVFQPEGLVHRNGSKFLNTHTRRPCAPAPEASVWGPEGKFKFLSCFFDGIFHPGSRPADPKKFFLSWLARFYRGAYECRPESGQNVFLLGGPGVGKTFLSQGLLPRLLGGSADAEAYLLGRTDFNSDLFQVGLWTVDDNQATVSRLTHETFSSIVKKMAANTTFQFNEKFRVSCKVEWLGRVLVTANDDEKSASIVPDLEISILDKLMLFRATAVAPVEFPGRRELLAILDDELPHFARFLLDYRTPAECAGSSRFGVVPYHEETLLRTAQQSSHSAGFQELLEAWIGAYFADKPDRSWSGTAAQLYIEMGKLPGFESALRGFSSQSFGLRLSALKSADCGFGVASDGSGRTRQWTIDRAKGMKTAAPPVGAAFGKRGAA